jgi:type II secretory pathway component GspD/PulD (secretin)
VALDQIKNPDGKVVYDESKRALILTDTAGKVDAMSAYVRKVDILLETEIFKLKYIGTADVVQDVQKALTEGVGQVKLDEQAKSVIVTDTPAAIGHIKEMINAKDRFNKEIHITTKILQIVLNDEHTMGVDWEAIVSGYQSLDFSGFTSGSVGQDGGKLSLGVISKEDYGVLLEALDTVGADSIISEEEIMTEPAQRQVVKILPVDLRGKEENRGAGEYVNYYITVSVNKEGTQGVTFEPELIGGQSDRSPSDKKPSASLQVNNEATIVVGSLFENVMVASTWKIPLLGDLPLLGFVFRNEGEAVRRAEIITFLTVKMVDKKK